MSLFDAVVLVFYQLAFIFVYMVLLRIIYAIIQDELYMEEDHIV